MAAVTSTFAQTDATLIVTTAEVHPGRFFPHLLKATLIAT